jgi:hypothetical protein
MPQLFINDKAQAAPIPAQTWGELLAALEAQADRDGVLLTAARFDGVDEPSFRDAAVVARPLRGVTELHIETAAPSAFLRQCLLDTIPSLRQSSEQARQTGMLFRGQDLTAAQRALTVVAGELRDLTSLMATLSGPLGIDMNGVKVDGVSGAAAVAELETMLGELVAAQQSDDWLTVADLLEYDLEPAMTRFAALLSVIADRLA